MPLDDLMPLAQDPKFLALSDPAKAIVLGKRDSGFAKLSPDAQNLLINKHFSKDLLSKMPAQDATGKYRDPSQQDWNIPYAKALLKSGGEQALRTGANVGGYLVGKALGGKLGGSAGAGIASAGVTALFRGSTKEIVEQGITGAVIPGPGKTAVRSAIKSGVYGAVSTTLDEAARTGKLPTKGQLAFNTAVSGVLGYGAYKLQPHLEEVFPKEVARDAARALEGKPSGIDAEAAGEIKQLRLNVTVRDPKGRYLSTKGLKTGSSVDHELDMDSIFPEYRAPFPEKVGKPAPLTAATAQFQRVRNVADKLESETGLPYYSDVYKSLHKAVLDPNPEVLSKEISRIRSTYKINPMGRMTVEQALVNDFINAAQGHQYNKALIYGVKGLRKVIPGVGKDISDADARRIVNSWMSAPYVSLLPGRAGPPIRVFSHTFQTGYMKTGRFIFKGLARATTKEGMQEAIRAGATGPEALNVPDEILGSGKSIYRKLIDAGFVGFRYAQDKSRASVFHAGRAKAENAWNTTKTWERFMDKADLDIGIPKAEVNVAKFLYDGGRKLELLDHIGRVYTESYIPGHTNMDRPFYSTKHPMATQFLNWPSFYGQTLVENFKGPYTAKHAAMAARWVGANAALYTVMRAYYGDDKKAAARTADFVFFGPVFFAGGPILQEVPGMIQGMKKMYHGGIDYMSQDMETGSGEFRQGLKQTVKSAPIPFKYAAKDAVDFTKWLIGGNEE